MIEKAASGDMGAITAFADRLDGMRAPVHPQRPRLGRALPHDAGAAAALPARSFLIDGEAVVVDAQGVASFALLRGRAREQQASCGRSICSSATVRICATCPRTAQGRAQSLAQPRSLGLGAQRLRGRPALFAQPCAMGLEGIVSKRRSSPYWSGRSPDWLKAKNLESPVARREALEDWGKGKRGHHYGA